MTDSTLRPATDADRDACVDIWVRACAHRDGEATPGVAERAVPKFGYRAAWIVAVDGQHAAEEHGAGEHAAGQHAAEEHITGFALAVQPGKGLDTDPADAVVVSLLAVDPDTQQSGLGRALMRALTEDLAQQGHALAVLHVLAENTAAVRLYESEGWRPYGEPFPHALLGRPVQTYARELS